MTGLLFLLSAARALVEVALLSLLGQGLVALLSGARRASNPVYRLFQIVTGPVLRGLRVVVPKVVIDRHLPYVAFFVLFWAWILLAYLKRLF